VVARERPPAVARLLEELDALERAYSTGHHGRWSATRRSGFVDVALRDLFAALGSPPGIALVALGGYGRGRLSPRSDIDVLIAHDGSAAERVAELVEALLYPLWDAGFRVGHGVRTHEESLELADARLDARTSMLVARVVAGDADVFRATGDAVRAMVRRDARAFAETLRADAEERRERAGAVSSLLEPDLKQGAGGLRDVQMLGWLEIATGRQLEDVGVLRPIERAAVDAADEFLERVRGALHLTAGREGDRLVLEQQPAIARALGFADEPGLTDVDALMRQVFEHARQIEHVTRSALARAAGEAPGDVGVEIEPTPEGVLAGFAAAAERSDGLLPTTTLDRIQEASVPEAVGWTDEVRDAFLRVVRSEGGTRALETLDRLGLLVRFLPAWRDVRCRPQRDPYHRSSVDVHLLGALAGMRALLEGRSTDPVLVDAAASVEDRDGALLGALFHDIGKVGRGAHVAEGVRIVEETFGAMGIDERSRALATFLVREHLLLSDTATRRDLEDEDLIHDVAARVGDPERLAALTLLTIADAEATGPLAWTPWRAALVRELVNKVQRVLERGEVGPQTAVRLAERVEELRTRLAGVDPDELERFFLRMPRSYLLTMPVETIAAQHPLIAPRLQLHEVRTLATQGTRPGTYALTVVAADRAGLLSMIAGALSLAGLSILSAQVFTTDDGTAVDVFEVEGTFEREVGEERWRDFRSILRKAIEGRVSLAHRVDEKRRRYPAPRGEVPIRVAVDNSASDFSTVIEVGAADRIGLLFDVTRTLSELGLDVHLAKVATYGDRVVDAFYVRDELGRKVDDDDRIAELRRVLEARLV
jgi:[protein-PII] uridylyltransferase